jgi:hypothetical protein
MNMLEEHDRPSNHRPEEEDMDMAGIHMVKVEAMDMMVKYPSKERSEVKDMDMMEDMMTEVVEREHKGVVLARYWISDGVERHGRTHRQLEELAKSECLRR